MAGAATAERQGWSAGQETEFSLTPTTVLLLLFNLLDGLFTLLFLQMEVAEELNPLMRLAYEGSPLSFMALKLGIVHFGVFVLCLHRDLKLARVALALGAVLYVGIVAYHLAFLGHLLVA